MSERCTLREFLANVNCKFKFAICYRRSVCLSVVCLSVTLVHPTQPVKIFGNFSSPYDSTKTEICAESDPPPFRVQRFRPISAHSASSVIASEQSSISTYRKSTTRFPTSHRWTVYVTPKSPKGWHKNAISLFVSAKFNFSRK